MIALQREANSAAGSATRVRELPMWIGPRSRAGTYWHIPRSALDFGDRIAVSMWCGVSFPGIRGDLPLVDPPEGVKCGTCLGRYEGAHGLNGLVFTPRDDFALPRLCPGRDVVGGCCSACGLPVRWWLGRPQRHAPTSEFAERYTPCPDHGWTNVDADEHGRVVCSSTHVPWWGRCGFVCGPVSRSAAA
jgi:hypothetical protein